jgi:hypothetical protein
MTISAFGKNKAILIGSKIRQKAIQISKTFDEAHLKHRKMLFKPVVLVYSNSWEPYLFIIKTIAFAGKKDIWKFINPLLNAKLILLTLAELLIATFVVAKKTILVELIADKRETYKLLY